MTHSTIYCFEDQPPCWVTTSLMRYSVKALMFASSVSMFSFSSPVFRGFTRDFKYLSLLWAGWVL